MLVSLTPTYYRQILKEAEIVTLEHAVFRKEESFIHSNLKNFLPFWESEILKDHPHKHAILGWLSGVKIEEFLNSFTSTTFQGINPYIQRFGCPSGALFGYKFGKAK